MTTENHKLNIPLQGTLDWDEPLNENFRSIDATAEIRDLESNIDQYVPKDGSKFFATDTGIRYLGDGQEWKEAPTQPRARLTTPSANSDPDNASAGQIWFREDLDELRSNVGGQIVTLAEGGTDNDSDGPIVTIAFDDNSWEQLTDLDEMGREYRGSNVDGPAGHGKVLRVNIPNGEHYGSKFSFWFDRINEFNREYEEMWSRHYVYFDDSWNFGTTYSNGGKLPGFAGKYGACGSGGDKCDGTDGWTARMAHRPPKEGGDLRLGHYVYHANMSGDYGDTFQWNTNGEIEFNQWYKIDQRVVMNTPGKADGIIQSWVDGKLAQDEHSLKFRNSGYDNIKINSFKFNTFMGGGWVSERDCHCYYDDLALSPTKISSELEQA
jgi:hypothetical protein